MTTSVRNRPAVYTKFNGRKKNTKAVARRIVRSRAKAAIREES